MKNSSMNRNFLAAAAMFSAVGVCQAAPAPASLCAAINQVNLANANAALLTAVKNCVASAQRGSPLAACLKAAADVHQTALSSSINNLRTCIATATAK